MPDDLLDRAKRPTYEKRSPMLYDRSYMREDGSGAPFTTWKVLLIALGAVFLIQAVDEYLLGVGVLREWLGLSGSNLIDRFLIWTPLSYGLIHDGVFHLLFNGLGIFFLGRILETRLGSGRMLSLFLFTVLTGGLTWLVFNFDYGGGLIGASAGVFGILTVFCILHADERIQFLLFFVLPVSVKPKFLFMFVLGLEAFLFLFIELPGGSQVGYSAHLGGILGGFLYYRYLMERDTLFQKSPGTVKVEMPPWFKGKEGKKKPKSTVNLTSRSELKGEIDRILDKINSKGFGALSEEEKRLLDKARDLLNR